MIAGADDGKRQRMKAEARRGAVERDERIAMQAPELVGLCMPYCGSVAVVRILRNTTETYRLSEAGGGGQNLHLVTHELP